jgi:hypothetical protein
MKRRPRIELLHVRDCPLVGRLRAVLEDCLNAAGLPATVEQREGPYPSPTLLIDGRDVVTGKPPGATACCRLDLPSAEQIRAALDPSRA